MTTTTTQRQFSQQVRTLRSGLATSGRTHITGRIRCRNLMVAGEWSRYLEDLNVLYWSSIFGESCICNGLSILLQIIDRASHRKRRLAFPPKTCSLNRSERLSIKV